MSGASIVIESNSPAIQAAFGELVRRGADLAPVMSAIGGAMLLSTQRRFEREAGPGGEKWAPLSKRTIQRRPRRAPPAPILRDTNRLYSSLQFAADDASVEVGTNVVYGAVHQFGGEINVPEREGSAMFRFVPQGAGRAKDGRRVGSKLRFANARSRAKSRHTKTFTVGAHTIVVPARPYLGFDTADEAEILATLQDFLTDDLPGAAP